MKYIDVSPKVTLFYSHTNQGDPANPETFYQKTVEKEVHGLEE